MASAIINLLAAFFRMFPSLQALAEQASERAKRANAAEAVNRRAEKDRAVDAAIDGKGEDEGGDS